jgi:glycosyltransferase involved in cell wall biosynthesis
MVGILHLHPAPCDFQTRRSLELLQKSLAGDFAMNCAGIGPGAVYRNVAEAIIRLRVGQFSRTHIAHAWGPAELIVAAAAGFDRIIFSPQQAITKTYRPWIERIVRREGVHVVCPTAFLRDTFVASGAKAEFCKVIYPAVDPSRFDGSTADIRSKLGLADGDIAVLAPGESVRVAAHRESLWAVAILHVLDPRWRMLVWGRGPMVESLRRMARTSELPNVLVCAEDRLTDSRRFEQVALSADAAIISSRGGSPILPVAICMAGRVPIVAADTAEIREILRDEKTGVLESSFNPRRLAQRLLALQKDLSLRGDIISAAQASALKQFSPLIFTEEWRGIYRRFQT